MGWGKGMGIVLKEKSRLKVLGNLGGSSSSR